MHGRAGRRVAALLFGAALLVAAIAAAPAFGALPPGYDVTRVGPDSSAGAFGVGSRVGDSLVNAGDLNGDGKDDLVTGSPTADGGRGLVYEFSGADGSLIRTITRPHPVPQKPKQPAPLIYDHYDGGESTALLDAQDPPHYQCDNAADDDADGKVNDGCPAAGAAEGGTQCDNATDDDGDGKINDGCPYVGGGQPGQWGAHVTTIADTGATGVGFSCPGFASQDGAEPGVDCGASQTQMDTGDGVDDLLVTALGVDVAGGAADDDTGRVYVIDGATGSVLKRIDMPPTDRNAQALVSPTTNLKPGVLGSGAKPSFGRFVLSPAGQPPCVGNAGISPCASVPQSVKVGDLSGDASTVPDIVIAAPDYYDKNSVPAPNQLSGNPVCPNTCAQSGRVYIYNGESLRGRSPGTPLTQALTLKNPMPQADDPAQPSYTYPEWFGYSLSPLGDIGRCANEDLPAICTSSASHDPDGKPDFTVGAPRMDTFGIVDSGISLAFDGASDSVIELLTPPEPQRSALFGFANYNQPAIGDVAGNNFPDIYEPAILQDVAMRAQGRGYVFNGDVEGSASNYLLSVLDDPTPSKIGNFGTSAAGVGDVAGGEAGLNSRNEILIGAIGPEGGPTGGFENIINVFGDVSIFSPLTDQALQIISDPDGQPDTAFGETVAPLGDLNADGMLDFAVGAGGYGADQGRIYIFKSNATPPPSSSPPPPLSSGPPAGSQGTAAVAFAGRTLELEASKNRVRRGRRVVLRGLLEAFANPTVCQRGQRVYLQRRRPGQLGYVTFSRAVTNAGGEFSVRVKVRRAYYYRAWIGETASCLGAISGREKVTAVKAKKKRAKRSRHM